MVAITSRIINKFFNNKIGFKQLMIYFAIRNSIGIASSIIFSIRGKRFRQIIDDLRKLFVEIKGNHKNFKALNLFIIIFYLYYFILIIVFIVNNYRKNLNPIISSVSQGGVQVGCSPPWKNFPVKSLKGGTKGYFDLSREKP